LLCFNAAVSVFLLRGWAETGYINITASPYRVSPRVLGFRWLAVSDCTGMDCAD
jgi:alpha-1,2-mannosyltransferase